MEFELNYTLEELKHRTSDEAFSKIDFLNQESEEYKNLSKNDKKVVLHLAKACEYIDKIHFKMESEYNLPFLDFLNKEIEKGDERAELTKKLFLAQKSIFSPDIDGNQVRLEKNIIEPFAFGFYPKDLTIQNFHSILNKMLDEFKFEEVQNILTQRSIVVWNNEYLKGIDYTKYFEEEFKNAGLEILEASKYAENKDFKEFLVLQAGAFFQNNPYMDGLADKKWAEIDDNIIEFTITRETYNDRMTESIFANKVLNDRLIDAKITVNTKDNIGARLGIVNKEGTKLLKKLESLVNVAEKYMPYKNEYTKKEELNKISQKAVDVDLICLTGEEGAYQAGIVVAQNLPNDDKVSLTMGGGRKNVYHRQIRSSNVDPKVINAKINENFVKYYSSEAGHLGTICHENTHSLGPDGTKSLGAYSSIIEEFKADMGMYAFLNEFVEGGYFTLEEAKQIMVTELSGCFPKGKPTLNQAHRVRSVMIANRMLEEKAIDFDNEGKLIFDFDKIISTSQQMMKEVIRLQIDKDVKKAEEYVLKYFDWNTNFENMSKIQKEHSKKLNAYLSMPIYENIINN